MCAGLGARAQLTGSLPPRPTNRWLRQPTADDMATTLAMHIDLERPCRQAFYPNLPQTRGVLLYDWLKRTVLVPNKPGKQGSNHLQIWSIRIEWTHRAYA